jgi:hypothetical protein
MKQNKLPIITKKQRELIVHIYKFRYLRLDQLKQLAKIQRTSTLQNYLSDLLAKGYITQIEVTIYSESKQITVCAIGRNGIGYVRNIYREGLGDDLEPYVRTDINKRYRDTQRTHVFVRTCLILADCALAFICDTTKREISETAITTKADYICSDNPFNFLVDSTIMSRLGPQYCIEITATNNEGNQAALKTYLVESMSGTFPRYRIRARIDRYCRYLEEGSWQWERADPNPTVLLICPNIEILKYARNRAKLKLRQLWPEERDQIHIMFATRDEIVSKGSRAAIWSEA